MPDLLMYVLFVAVRGLLLAWLIGAAIVLAEKLARKESIPTAELILGSVMATAFAFSMGWLD